MFKSQSCIALQRPIHIRCWWTWWDKSNIYKRGKPHRINEDKSSFDKYAQSRLKDQKKRREYNWQVYTRKNSSSKREERGKKNGEEIPTATITV